MLVQTDGQIYGSSALIMRIKNLDGAFVGGYAVSSETWFPIVVPAGGFFMKGDVFVFGATTYKGSSKNSIIIKFNPNDSS